MSNELVEKVREDDRAMLLKTAMRTIERLAIPGETLASVATAAVNLVLEAAAERADAIKRENAESRDKHEPGIEPGHDDWISYNHGVFTAGEIADAIRALKGEGK